MFIENHQKLDLTYLHSLLDKHQLGTGNLVYWGKKASFNDLIMKRVEERHLNLEKIQKIQERLMFLSQKNSAFKLYTQASHGELIKNIENKPIKLRIKKEAAAVEPAK